MITEQQVATLRYLILKAEGTDLAKRVLTFLINRSEGLTRDVCVSLVSGREGYGRKEIEAAAHSVHNMHSVNHSVHIDALTTLMGSELHFSSSRTCLVEESPGHLQFNDLESADSPLKGQYCLSFWLTKENYYREAALFAVTREELEAIDLQCPGLHPILEPYPV